MKILLLADFGKPYYPAIVERYPDVEFAEAYSDDEIQKEIPDADVVFGYLTSEQFESAGSLQWIQTLDAGMEGLFGAVPQIADTDVIITNARGAGAPMIGEHAVTLMLALSRQLPRFADDFANKRWDQDGALHVVEFLGDKTVGIIGFGKSGRETGWRAKALGMKVIALDKHPIDGEPIVDRVLGEGDLDELLTESDYVVVTAPYTEENAYMIGADELKKMKNTARLVVTSRGRLFDHDALISALKDGTIAGAGLDSVWPEPHPDDSEIWDAPNLIISPHIAGNAEVELLDRRTVEIFEDNLERFLNGRAMINLVDRNLQY